MGTSSYIAPPDNRDELSLSPVSEEWRLPVVLPPHTLIGRHHKVTGEGPLPAAEVLLGEHAVRFRSCYLMAIVSNMQCDVVVTGGGLLAQRVYSLMAKLR